MIGCRCGHTDLIKFLLTEKNIDINSSDQVLKLSVEDLFPCLLQLFLVSARLNSVNSRV
jgi:hypothetical protein